MLAALVVAGACSSDGELMDLDRADGSTVPRTPASSAPGSSTAPTTTAGATAGPDPADGTTTPPAAAIDLGATCTWALADVTIRYPTGWHTPEPGSTGSCVLFDPAPVTVPVDSEAPLVAVAASYDDRALDSAAAATFDPSTGRSSTSSARPSTAGPAAAGTSSPPVRASTRSAPT
ncbi:MAG: hypothetical protein R2699_08235 [Acidimicrobiales bacterium]